MDVALMIERLIPSAEYSGSLTENNKAAFDALTWTDATPKPSWQDILDEWDAYQASPDGKEYKLYEYMSGSYEPTETPYNIDFQRAPMQRLHPKYTFNFGELVEVIHYASQTLNEDGLTFTYSEPVVKETYNYTRDSSGFPVSRVQTITWFFDDGTEDTANPKTRMKIYADKSVDTLSELVRRRDNNIKEIIGSLIGIIMVTRPGTTKQDIINDGKTFFSQYNDQRTNYIYEGTEELEEAVRDTSMFPWFADDISGFTPYTTIRNFIIYQLSMGLRSS